MALPPPTAPLWYRPTAEPKTLVIASELQWWHGHYDPRDGQPHRCGGSICTYCDAGRTPELRFVLGCADVDGQRWLLELRERHRAILTQIDQSKEGFVGTKIEVYKRGQAINSPVQVDVVGFVPERTLTGLGRRDRPEGWDIRLLVDALGMHDPR